MVAEERTLCQNGRDSTSLDSGLCANVDDGLRSIDFGRSILTVRWLSRLIVLFLHFNQLCVS